MKATIALLVLAAALLALAGYLTMLMYREASACSERGGVQLRTHPFGYECVKLERL